jgi:hypothetical protein
MDSLADIIRTIAGKKPSPVKRDVPGAFFVQGVVEQVLANGTLMVAANGTAVMAKPVTDETITKGMRVWVSSTADTTTWLVHGGVR